MLFVTFGSWLKAQQVEDFSLIRENAFILNPAIAGTNGYLHGTATFRKQFLKIDQSPYTAMLALDGEIKDKNIGIGGYVIQDQTGPTGKTSVTVSAAYHIPLQSKYGRHYTNGDVDHSLSIGVSLSFVQYRLDGSKLLYNDAGDPGLYSTNGYKFWPDASIGVYYRWKENLFVGASVPQLMGLNVNYRADDGTAKIKKLQHVNFVAGGKIQWARGNFSIDPIVAFHWVKGAPPQGEVGLRFVIYKVFFIGSNYRSLSQQIFEAGFNVKDIVLLSYAYDLNFSKYRTDLGSTHEISLSFKLTRPGRVWRGAGPALRF